MTKLTIPYHMANKTVRELLEAWNRHRAETNQPEAVLLLCGDGTMFSAPRNAGWLEGRVALKNLFPPELRPWKPHEVPFGALVEDFTFTRRHSHPVRWNIDAIFADSVHLSGALENTPYNVLANRVDYDFQHSTDGGKTWKPCGVLEEA